MEAIESTREFLDRRERGLIEDIDRLRGQLTPKEAELAEVRRAKGALGIAPLNDDGRAPYARLTMKELVRKALAEHFPNGATTRQLIGFFQDAYRRTIKRKSLGPQLTRLRRSGEIVQDGHVWRLGR